MTVSWTVPAGKDLFINAFDVEWTQVTGVGVSGQQRYSGATRSATIHGLIPGVAYNVEVTSMNNQTQAGSERTSFVTAKQATSK